MARIVELDVNSEFTTEPMDSERRAKSEYRQEHYGKVLTLQTKN